MKAKLSEFKHIVRIADTDLDGTLKVAYALSRIRGIGITLAYAIARLTGIDPNARLGSLSDADLKKLEEAVRNVSSLGLPAYMLNRRKDPETGRDLHLIGSDLVMAVKLDVDRLKKIKCWRGIRHALGLKVRGQCTKTTGRFGKTVGVTRKAK
ncbi:MAG: 30S ribosomal protein S13 [Candidatus Methanomethylicota archaeon]|uniref:Small ribosomal subunit protein uS13 n=1 Tax=Thermoproteota archaeon TaxID=2056631 RepID=A0A497F0L9_9CREN|nr:MAG: 30S ribosomal protein S13 [Candidatus Verstraetearchaeota archaeon]RLE52470.1 MAG: 30S ribosomal protein S13 [Candidatus Verstraetearchaeota archaeon]